MPVRRSTCCPRNAGSSGTVRALSAKSAETARLRLKQICEGICSAHGVTGSVALEHRYPVTVNDARCSAYAATVAGQLWGPENTDTDYKASMASEDFAFMLNEVPGSYAWIGTGTDVPLHNPAFDFNDELIPLGARYWIALVENWQRHT